MTFSREADFANALIEMFGHRIREADTLACLYKADAITKTECV